MNPSALGAICYEPEAAWAENIGTFATLRVPIIGPVDCSGLKHDKIDGNRTQQYMNGGLAWIPGVQSGSFKTKFFLPGHGSTTAAATTIGLVEQLLGYVFGNVTSSGSGTTAGAGSTASSVTTVASGTFPAGGLCRVGAGGLAADARGNGQFYGIVSHIATALSLLTATDAAAAAADVVYSAINVYTVESPTGGNAPQSLRFLLQTANMRYECHGVVPTDIKIDGLNVGQIPTVEITWAVSWFGYNTGAAFPSTITTEVFPPAANAAGSLFVNVVGTATRAKRTHRTFTLDIKLGMKLEVGPGGVSPYQQYVGARRTPNDIKITWTEDAEASGTHTLDDLFMAGTPVHVLLTLSTNIGQSMALYFRNVNLCGARPLQMAADDINRLTIQGEANTGPINTTDLTGCAMVMGFA